MTAKSKTWKQDILDNEQAFITVIRIAAEIGSFLESSPQGEIFRKLFALSGMSGSGEDAVEQCGNVVTMLSKWLAVAKGVQPSDLVNSILADYDRVNKPVEA